MDSIPKPYNFFPLLAGFRVDWVVGGLGMTACTLAVGGVIRVGAWVGEVTSTYCCNSRHVVDEAGETHEARNSAVGVDGRMAPSCC